MHRNLFVGIVFIVLLFHSAASGEELKTVDDVTALTENVMQSIAANDLKAAFDKMTPHTVLTKTEIEAGYLQLKAQRDQEGYPFGRAIAYEFISSIKLGTSLIRLQYIEKTPKSAIAWTFVFYNSGSGWSLIHFKWSNAMTLFDEN